MRALIAGVLVAAAVTTPLAHADMWDGRKHPTPPTFTVHPGIAHGKGKHHRAGFCVDDDHMCLPGNSEGKPAACYDEGGVIVALWPCHDEYIGNGQWDVVADPGSPDYDPELTYTN